MQAQVKPIRRVIYRQLAGDYEKILREMTWMCHEKGLEKAIKELQGKYSTYHIVKVDLTTEEDEDDVNLVRIIDFSEIRSNEEWWSIVTNRFKYPRLVRFTSPSGVVASLGACPVAT